MTSLRTGSRSAVLAAALVLAAAAAPALAAGPGTWDARVQKADGLLAAHDFAAALKVTGPLLDEVGNRVQAGPQGEAALGAVLALHALAEAGTGDQTNAALDWYLAQSLKRNLVVTSLERYGVAGERLHRLRLSTDEDEPCHLANPGMEIADPEETAEAQIEPPRKLRAPQPQYTAAARATGLQGIVHLSVVIDTEGRVTAPCVVRADSPIFVYMLRKVLPDWRFEPARRDGEPIATYYDLTTSFTLGN